MFVLSAGEYFLQMKQYIKHMQTNACWSCLGWGWSPMDECGQSHSTLFLFWCIFPGSHHKVKKSNRSNTRTENKQTNKQTKTSQMALGQRLFPGGSHGQESACSVGDQVQSLGQEDPLERGMATHSSILARRTPWTEEPGGLQAMGSSRGGQDWATNTLTFTRGEGWHSGSCWIKAHSHAAFLIKLSAWIPVRRPQMASQHAEQTQMVLLMPDYLGS